MFDNLLRPQQLIVIAALSDGVNMTDAAAQAGVHRNTIANWRRNFSFFREALADAQYDRALLSRDKTERMLDYALDAIKSVLTDPKASPSARLKAALFIVEKATTPPAPRQQVPFDVTEIHVSQHTVPPTAEPDATPAPEQTTPENPPAVHNHAQSAQTPYRRETPKVGRNELCPCLSGRKFKHCCLNKPTAAQPKAA